MQAKYQQQLAKSKKKTILHAISASTVKINYAVTIDFAVRIGRFNSSLMATYRSQNAQSNQSKKCWKIERLIGRESKR